MKNLRKKMMLVAGALAGASAFVFVLVACSSSDTVVTGDAGSDTGTDGSKTDGGGSDAGTDAPQDAGKDVIQVEAGTLAEFIKANADATCQRYKDCCTAGTTKTFDLAKCQNDFKTVGWNQSLSDINGTGADGGGANLAKLQYDPATGGECLTAIRNMTCANTPAAEFKNAWVKCFGAVKGTVATGGACASNVECNPNAWCDGENDGGTCTPFKGAGSQCTPLTGQCSYRAVGTPQCVDDGTGTYKCLPPLADTKTCAFDPECSSGACSVRDGGATVLATCEQTTDFLFGICSMYLQ